MRHDPVAVAVDPRLSEEQPPIPPAAAPSPPGAARAPPQRAAVAVDGERRPRADAWPAVPGPARVDGLDAPPRVARVAEGHEGRARGASFPDLSRERGGRRGRGGGRGSARRRRRSPASAVEDDAGDAAVPRRRGADAPLALRRACREVAEVYRAPLDHRGLRRVRGQAVWRRAERGAAVLQRRKRRRERRRRDFPAVLADERGLIELEADLLQPKWVFVLSCVCRWRRRGWMMSGGGAGARKKVEGEEEKEGKGEKTPTSRCGESDGRTSVVTVAFSLSFARSEPRAQRMHSRLRAVSRNKRNSRSKLVPALLKEKRACLFFRFWPPTRNGIAQALRLPSLSLPRRLHTPCAHSAGSGACPSMRAVS